ncbi:MAG: hypothetical protein ABI566_10675 [Pseudolysinimonas sp.]
MRRALLLVAAGLALAVGAVLAFVLPPSPSGTAGEPHITRVFIPAVKSECLDRAGIARSLQTIGFTFTEAGALRTIDTDGSLTGIEPDRLEAFNACLAEYPIQPDFESPHDHYSRNLLYDYFADVLQPCLSSRVGPGILPPMPRRSDFVVRLYGWDPYRSLAPTRDLGELLELSAACPDRPVYLTAPRIPTYLDAG